VDRKLAAIFAADVVGYSALMERDENGTFARLKAHRTELFEPEIKKHQGRVFKLMGDGLLAEFGSVVAAVECAIAVQNELAKRNALVPEEERIDIRIGINLGDVIIEGEDVHGDGVNIANRLQGLAKRGGIVVSGTVYDQVRNKLDAGIEFLGEQRVKNIAEPIRTYAVHPGTSAARPATPATSAALRRRWSLGAIAALIAFLGIAGVVGWQRSWMPATDSTAVDTRAAVDGKLSLAVLPFDNLSDDREQGYLADGITEDLTTELARIPGLFVISRNAAFRYKGQDVQLPQIARELGVRYIIEGSIRRAGDDLRLNAQLIDAGTGGHVWAERFDGKWADVFELQDTFVGNIATALKLRLVDGQQAAEVAGGTRNPAAYEAYLRGLEHYYRATPEDIVKAANHFQQATALDPSFGAAEAMLAFIYWDSSGNEPRMKALGLSDDEIIARMYAHLDAAAKHPSVGYYQILAQLLVRQQKSDEAIAALQKGIALDPSDPGTYDSMSEVLTFNGRAPDGLSYIDAAMRLDPGWTNWRHYLAGLAHFSMGRFEDAITSLEKIDMQSDEFWPKFYGLQVLAASYGHLDRSTDITSVKGKLSQIMAEFGQRDPSVLFIQNFFAFKNEIDFVRLLEGLRKVGMPELPFGLDARSKDRLTGTEIKALLFGHDWQGSEVGTGVAWLRSIGLDGTGRATFGDRSDRAEAKVEGDTMCTYFPTRFRLCDAIFRNPAGSFEKKNEYLLVGPWSRFEFSVVK